MEGNEKFGLFQCFFVSTFCQGLSVQLIRNGCCFSLVNFVSDFHFFQIDYDWNQSDLFGGSQISSHSSFL